MRPQSMDAAVMTLETAGTVLRTPDPNDGRKRVLERSAAMLNKIERSRTVRRDSLARRIERNSAPPSGASSLAHSIRSEASPTNDPAQTQMRLRLALR